MPTIIEEKDVPATLKKRSQFQGVIAVIPAFNAGDTIADVIRKIRRKVPRCVVVDDGSSDNTATAAERANAEVILHISNRGKGAAIRTAFESLKNDKFNYLILLDADGQHEPGEMYRFIQHARRTRADIVCGNRMKNPKGMPWLRRATNRTMSAIISTLCGVRIHDTQCGYRLISRRAVRTIEIKKSNFEVDSEILLEASFHGLKVSEVSVTSIYGDEHSSHIRPARDTLRFFHLLIDLAFARMKKGPRKKSSREKSKPGKRKD
jgi:glycosyltransferase involved in cell wall biosynthesis